MNWERFVLNEGAGIRAEYLAAIVGQPAAAIRRVRAAGRAGRQPRPLLSFAEAFARWHGREPAEADWPTPMSWGLGYEWLPPEDALVASLVGRLTPPAIARILTQRLRKVTGDRRASRNAMSVQIRMNRLGLVSTDVVGGLTVPAAGREIGSVEIVRNAIRNGGLRTHRVGRLIVIPYDTWEQWKASRVLPPKGYIQLSKLREPLGIRSDKLSEFARMGYVPTAVRCNPALPGQKSTKFGTWYVDRNVARKLLADRRAGRPMPWHGQALADNQRVTWSLWRARQHPSSCATCREIWGKAGAPSNFEDYCKRYPPLAHGAKRHLTRQWSDGVTVTNLAKESKQPVGRVLQAIANGTLRATKNGRLWTITRTDATRWKARRCPSGVAEKSWISLKTAKAWYGFSMAELQRRIANGTLKKKVGTNGPMRGIVYVPRQQCADLRNDIGYTERQAAKRVGVPLGAFRDLLKGVNWRGTGLIPLVTVQAVIKRLQSQSGYTIAEAAEATKASPAWVRDRIKDGTIRISRARGDKRRLYITAPMLERLKAAKRKPNRVRRLTRAWISLRDAAAHAGVSTATILNWAAAGDLKTARSLTGTHYLRRSVTARARSYWRTVRFHRATPPAWLQAEGSRA